VGIFSAVRARIKNVMEQQTLSPTRARRGSRLLVWRGLATAFSVGAGLLLSSSAWSQGAAPLTERLLLCGGCHNPDGNSLIAENPKLAGMHPSYLKRQLADFKAGKRKSATMGAIIAMVDESEFGALATYFSEQKPKPVAAVDAKTVAAGKEIFDDGITASAVPACSGCHNEDGSGTDKYPRVTGQHMAYVVQQLLNLKSGERDNDERGVMRAVAKRLTEAQIKAVAQYIATLQDSEK
jgi:cytochrome c553